MNMGTQMLTLPPRRPASGFIRRAEVRTFVMEASGIGEAVGAAELAAMDNCFSCKQRTTQDLLSLYYLAGYWVWS